jgi:hypothetical protein
VAFAMIYERMQRHRDDDERLRIDALIGMPGAQEEFDRRRMDAVGAFGIEVG